MKHISKYYYADAGMTFRITRKGFDMAECRLTFLDYPNGLPKVPIDWVDNGYVEEVINGKK